MSGWAAPPFAAAPPGPADRDLIMVQMHGFAASGVDEIAQRSRGCMGRIFTTIAETGGTPERIRDFIAHGMLLNVLLSMRVPQHLDVDAALTPFAVTAFGDALEVLVPDR